MNNIKKLDIVNRRELSGDEAKAAVTAFLREMADKIESGEQPADKCILVMRHDAGGEQQYVGSRSCNVPKYLERVGLLQLALHDTCDI